MRWTYFIIRVLFVVLIMIVVINLLLVFNPFSLDETTKVKENEKVDEILPKDGIEITDEHTNDEIYPEEMVDPSQDIIGYEKSEADIYESQIDGHDDNNDFFLTYEEIMAMKDVSFSDKIFGLSIMRKFDKSDMEKMLRIADGGITNKEWKTMSEIMQKCLDDKEMDRIEDVVCRNKSSNVDNMVAKE